MMTGGTAIFWDLHVRDETSSIISSLVKFLITWICLKIGPSSILGYPMVSPMFVPPEPRKARPAWRGGFLMAHRWWKKIAAPEETPKSAKKRAGWKASQSFPLRINLQKDVENSPGLSEHSDLQVVEGRTSQNPLQLAIRSCCVLLVRHHKYCHKA